jgi:hypothetical protein
MDSKTRSAILTRDDGVARIRTATRRVGVVATVGALIAGAGFAHLIPTRLPQVNVGQSGSGGSGSNGTSNSGGLQGPGTGPGSGSGPSQVTSGGS